MVMAHWLRQNFCQKVNYKLSYWEDFMHHALAASCYFVNAAFRNMRLARICGSYLCPASLPKEPMVRRGLEGLTQEGSGVFCTSVLTSGSISEGEGVSLAPAMALCLPSIASSRERPMRFFLRVSEQALSATDAAEKSHPRLTVAARRRRESVYIPAASQGPQTHWGEHQLVSCLSSAPPSLMEMRGPMRLWDSHGVTKQRQLLGQPNGTPTGYITKMVKCNDPGLLQITTACQSSYFMSVSAWPALHLY